MAVIYTTHPRGCECYYCPGSRKALGIHEQGSQVVARKELRIHRSKLDGDGLTGDMIREILLEMAAIGLIESSMSHWEGDTCVIEIFPGQGLDGFTLDEVWNEYTKQLEQEGHPALTAIRGILAPA